MNSLKIYSDDDKDSALVKKQDVKVLKLRLRGGGLAFTPQASAQPCMPLCLPGCTPIQQCCPILIVPCCPSLVPTGGPSFAPSFGTAETTSSYFGTPLAASTPKRIVASSGTSCFDLPDVHAAAGSVQTPSQATPPCFQTPQAAGRPMQQHTASSRTSYLGLPDFNAPASSVWTPRQVPSPCFQTPQAAAAAAATPKQQHMVSSTYFDLPGDNANASSVRTPVQAPTPCFQTPQGAITPKQQHSASSRMYFDLPDDNANASSVRKPFQAPSPCFRTPQAAATSNRQHSVSPMMYFEVPNFNAPADSAGTAFQGTSPSFGAPVAASTFQQPDMTMFFSLPSVKFLTSSARSPSKSSTCGADPPNLQQAALFVSVVSSNVKVDSLTVSEASVDPSRLLHIYTKGRSRRGLFDELSRVLESTKVNEFVLPDIDFNPNEHSILSQFEVTGVLIVMKKYDFARHKLFTTLKETKQLKEAISSGKGTEELFLKYKFKKRLCLEYLKSAIKYGYCLGQVIKGVASCNKFTSVIENNSDLLKSEVVSVDKIAEISQSIAVFLNEMKEVKEKLSTGNEEMQNRLRIIYLTYRRHLLYLCTYGKMLEHSSRSGSYEQSLSSLHLSGRPQSSRIDGRNLNQSQQISFKLQCDVNAVSKNHDRIQELETLIPKERTENPLANLEKRETQEMQKLCDSYQASRRNLFASILNRIGGDASSGSGPYDGTRPRPSSHKNSPNVQHLVAVQSPNQNASQEEDFEIFVNVVPEKVSDSVLEEISSLIPQLNLYDLDIIDDSSLRQDAEHFNRSYERGRELQASIQRRKAFRNGQSESDQDEAKLMKLVVSLLEHKSNLIKHQDKMLQKLNAPPCNA